MNIKFKKSGFTLIELIIASTMATFVLTISFALIGNIYFAHKQIRLSQNFYSEGRFLLEKIVKISRENTIDYDRYFEEIGPDSTAGECPSFNLDQIGFGGGTNANNSANRASLGYPNIFYWRISDGVYRNLGGANISGGLDNCAQAFHGTLTNLYLINEDRNIRSTIRNNNNRIQTSVELGADVDGNGKADPDQWSYYVKWEDNGSGTDVCNLYDDDTFNASTKRQALVSTEDVCFSAHGFENVSAKRLFVDDFLFTPYPDRDPYLNFRNDETQIHPNVFLYLKIDLLDYEDYAFATQPTITMQTSTSSRIFKNTRE